MTPFIVRAFHAGRRPGPWKAGQTLLAGATLLFFQAVQALTPPTPATSVACLKFEAATSDFTSSALEELSEAVRVVRQGSHRFDGLIRAQLVILLVPKPSVVGAMARASMFVDPQQEAQELRFKRSLKLQQAIAPFLAELVPWKILVLDTAPLGAPECEAHVQIWYHAQ